MDNPQSRMHGDGISLGDGRKLFMHGPDGIPFRGNAVPTLKKEETAKLADVQDAKVKVFNTKDPAQLAEYERICDCIIKGYYSFSHEEINWVLEDRSYYILLRYIENYKELPGELQNRVQHNGQGLSTK